MGHGVRVIIGELSDADAIDRAVAGADAVVSALGPSLDRKATGLPRAYKELIGTTDLLRNAGVDWTIVRFTAPNNKPENGNLRVGFYGADRIGFAVSRADIAAFTAEQVDDDTHLNRAPAISN